MSLNLTPDPSPMERGEMDEYSPLHRRGVGATDARVRFSDNFTFKKHHLEDISRGKLQLSNFED
jgi:hypothetical protein